MLKKVIPIVLMLCLLFSTSVMAENENSVSEETVPEVSEQMPQDAWERPQGGRGNMGMPPSDDRQGRIPPNMQNFNGQAQEEVPMTFSGFVKTYSTPITSVVLLGLAFIFVIFYRRKNY